MSAPRHKVLLVEDEQPLVSLYKEYLKDESLDITQAVNPANDFAGHTERQLEVSACDQHVKVIAFGGTPESMTLCAQVECCVQPSS